MKSQRGFSLVKTLIFLVIVVAGFAVILERMHSMGIEARKLVIRLTISDLNAREMDRWGSIIASRQYNTDDDVWRNHEHYLSGPTYNWINISQRSAIVNVSGYEIILFRTASTPTKPAKWGPST